MTEVGLFDFMRRIDSEACSSCVQGTLSWLDIPDYELSGCQIMSFQVTTLDIASCVTDKVIVSK